MDHFPIVSALCRAALASPSDAVRRQVERLRDALLAENASDQARSIANLLSTADRTAPMVPSRLIRSASSAIAAEELTPRTILPVDKESANPLCQVLFPQDLPDVSPILDAEVTPAVQSLLEEWENLELLEGMGVSPSRSCLIYGVPGTGKTQLALWMARQLGLPVVLARLDGLISSFLGTTSRNISALFAFAARYHCLLLLDEFDAIAKLRDDPQEVGEIKRVVNAVLQNLDARKAIGLTIGITNHEALLDPAIWRRFETQLAIPKPSFEARVAIARSYFPPLPLDEVSLRFLAWLTENATGAEIEMLVKSLKKRLVLSGPSESSPLDGITQFLALHSGRIDEAKRDLLRLRPEDLARTLIEHAQLGFDQTDLAALFGRDKATISRWLKRETRPRFNATR
jgi:SpoVK/Ycf46/Vps4 family AAA+-type ATPase